MHLKNQNFQKKKILNHNVEKVKKFQHSNFYRTKIEQKFQHFVNST